MDMNKSMTRIIIISICIIVILLITPISNFQSYASPSNESKEQVTLVAILEDQGDPERWDALIQPAIDELKMRHPTLNIRINYTTFPYDQAKTQMISEYLIRLTLI
jgi:uncharacterized membrane protein YvbJ